MNIHISFSKDMISISCGQEVGAWGLVAVQALHPEGVFPRRYTVSTSSIAPATCAASSSPVP